MRACCSGGSSESADDQALQADPVGVLAPGRQERELVRPARPGRHHLDRQPEREVERPQRIAGADDQLDQVGQGGAALGGAGQLLQAGQIGEAEVRLPQPVGRFQPGHPGVAARQPSPAEIDAENRGEHGRIIPQRPADTSVQ
jgi:hypothetical protein